MKRLFAILMAVILLLPGCATREASRSGTALDTVVTITVYNGADKGGALDAAFAEINRLEQLFSTTISGSDIETVNRLGSADVSDDTLALLQTALKYGALSDGALDITIGTVSRLWAFDSDKAAVPDAAVLADALKNVDYTGITLSGHTVSVKKGMSIDLGAVAKGYIADRLKTILAAHDVTSALIDLGGNLYAVGKKNGRAFHLGITDPADGKSIIATFDTEDRSAVTSGVYERCFTRDGVTYHHLLDPKTGYPVRNGLASVTIISKSSAEADALSTACFVLGEEKARALLQTLPDVEAVFITDKGTITTTGLTVSRYS